MDYKIVPMGKEHIESYHRALDAVARERKYLALLEAPPLDKTREYILDGLKNNAPRVVALVDGEVVGWCDITPVSDRPVHAHAGFLTIGIMEAGRGKGMGAALMKAAIQRAKDLGLTRIELVVREENTPAISLYKKLGFEIEGLKRKANFVDGVYENAHVMGLLL